MLTSHVPSFEGDGQQLTKSGVKLRRVDCRQKKNSLERGTLLSSVPAYLHFNTAKLCPTGKALEESLSATTRGWPAMNFST